MLYSDKCRAAMKRREIAKLESERETYSMRGAEFAFAVRVTTRLIETAKAELRPIERRIRETEIREGEYRLRRAFA